MVTNPLTRARVSVCVCAYVCVYVSQEMYARMYVVYISRALALVPGRQDVSSKNSFNFPSQGNRNPTDAGQKTKKAAFGSASAVTPTGKSNLA